MKMTPANYNSHEIPNSADAQALGSAITTLTAAVDAVFNAVWVLAEDALGEDAATDAAESVRMDTIAAIRQLIVGGTYDHFLTPVSMSWMTDGHIPGDGNKRRGNVLDHDWTGSQLVELLIDRAEDIEDIGDAHSICRACT
jgi:hypothetical protein